MTAKQTKNYTKNIQSIVTLPYVIRFGILALAYVLAAKFGLSLAFSTQQVTTVWPPTGIALAALFILGYRFWPAILLGAFVANILTDDTAVIAGFIAVGNTLEALVGTYLLRRVVKFDPGFSRIKDFLGLLFLAGMLSTAISATIGTLSLTWGGIVAQQDFARTWLVWWIGDMMGMLIFAPLIFMYNKNKLASLRNNQLEAFVLFALTLTVGILVFRRITNPELILPYMVFPFIMWAGLRFTQAGAVVFTTLVAATAVWGTTANVGPFARSNSTDQNLVMLHVFLLVLITTSILLAITVDQQTRTEQKLRARTEDLKEANRRIKNLLAGALGQSGTKRTKTK